MKKLLLILFVLSSTGCSTLQLDQTQRAIWGKIHTEVGMQIRQIENPDVKRVVADVILCDITCDTDYSEKPDSD